ncbi:MAG: OmpH family outer membrane protein [Rickettsiales bacterium]
MSIKTIKTTTIGLLAATFLAVSASTALAADTMIVDTQKIFESSSAVKQIREQIDKKAEEFKKDSTDKEAYFKKKYDDLEKQKSVLKKDEFEQKNNDLAKEFGEAQKKVQDSRTVLDKAYTDAMQKVETVFNDVVKAEATKKGAKVVLHKMQTIYSDTSLDLTDPVLAELNKQMPKATVSFSAASSK